MPTETKAFAAASQPEVSSPTVAQSSEGNAIEFKARVMPDLRAVFERETHASLLFDDHPDGKCLLAVGARRSFTWSGENAESLDSWNEFLQPN